MLQHNQSRQQQDMRAFGLVLRELMELGSVWTAEMRDFQEKLDHKEAGPLSFHEFLKKSPGMACLIPHARIAMRTKVVMLRVLP
jgi:hypothetical protein